MSISTAPKPDAVTEKILADVPKATTTATATAKLKSAAKKAARKPTAAQPKPAAKAKPKPTKKAAAKKSRYPEWVKPAVAASRHLSGMKDGELGDTTLNYAGPRQHIRARKEITAMIEGDVTAAALLKVTGMKSVKALTEVATWTAPRDSMKPMRPLASKFRDDSWLGARYLAAVVVVWINEVKRAAKS
jgi:hypothetical protein